MILAATVVTAEHKKILKNLSVPVILVGQQYSGHCCVYHDDYHATRDLTEAVLDMGRKIRDISARSCRTRQLAQNVLAVMKML